MERGLVPCGYKVPYLGSLLDHQGHPALPQHCLDQLWDWGYPKEQIYGAAAPGRALQGQPGWPMAGELIPSTFSQKGSIRQEAFSLFLFFNFITLLY